MNTHRHLPDDYKNCLKRKDWKTTPSVDPPFPNQAGCNSYRFSAKYSAKNPRSWSHIPLFQGNSTFILHILRILRFTLPYYSSYFRHKMPAYFTPCILLHNATRFHVLSMTVEYMEWRTIANSSYYLTQARRTMWYIKITTSNGEMVSIQ